MHRAPVLLSSDLCGRVAVWLSARDVERARLVCRGWRLQWNAPQVWMTIAHNTRGAEFWRRARRRPAVSSRPLGCWREEVRRLHCFDALCEKKLGKSLPDSSFYLLWQVIDHSGTGGK